MVMMPQKVKMCLNVYILFTQGILNLDLSGLISTSPENWEYVLARLSADFHRLKNLKLRNNNFTKVAKVFKTNCLITLLAL